MNELKIIKKVKLLQRHYNTGKTKHFYNGKISNSATQLQITNINGEDSFYLIHLNEAGEEIADTFHETIDDTFQQAEWEYRVEESEWSNFAN